MCRLWSLWPVFLAVRVLAGPTVEVVVEPESREITTADSVHWTLAVRAAEATDVGLPLPAVGSRLGDLTVASAHRPDEEFHPVEAELTHRLHLVLYPGLPGEYTVAPVEFRIDGEILSTEPVAIRVNSVLPADTDAQALEPRPVAPLPRRFPWVLVAAASILSVLVLLWWRFRNRGTRPLDEPAQPSPEDLPAEVSAGELHTVVALPLLRTMFGDRADTMAPDDPDLPAPVREYLALYHDHIFAGSAQDVAPPSLREALAALPGSEG